MSDDFIDKEEQNEENIPTPRIPQPCPPLADLAGILAFL